MTRHFYARSRFPAPRFEILSARTAREIGPACLFRFKSFEISADNHLCRRSHKETHFRIGRRERCLDSRSVQLAMRGADSGVAPRFPATLSRANSLRVKCPLARVKIEDRFFFVLEDHHTVDRVSLGKAR